MHLNGTPLQFEDQQPVIQDGTTLVPFRAIFESLGFRVEWNGTESDRDQGRDGNRAGDRSLTAKVNGQADDRNRRTVEAVVRDRICPADDGGRIPGRNTIIESTSGYNQFAKEQSLAMYAYLNTLPISVETELKTIKWDILPLPVFTDLPGVGTQSYLGSISD
jgi:hypothetical protein